MITERNDGQNCKNKTEIDSNKLDSSFNVCSKSIPALILPDDLTVPSTLTVTSNIMSPWPEANCPSLVHAGIQLQGRNSSLSAFENVETFNWRGTVFLVPNTWNQLWSWHNCEYLLKCINNKPLFVELRQMCCYLHFPQGKLTPLDFIQFSKWLLKLLLQVLHCNSISRQVSGSSAEGWPDLWSTWGGVGIGQVGHPLRDPGAEPELVQRLGGQTERENPICEFSQEKQRDLLYLIMNYVILLQKSWLDIKLYTVYICLWVMSGDSGSLSLIYALPYLNVVNGVNGKGLPLPLWWTLFCLVIGLVFVLVQWSHNTKNQSTICNVQSSYHNFNTNVMWMNKIR